MRRLVSLIWGRRYDFLVCAGAAVVAFGVGLIFAPAGVIVGGASLAWWGMVGAKTEATRRLP